MAGVMLDSEDSLVFSLSEVNILNKIRQYHKDYVGKCFEFFSGPTYLLHVCNSFDDASCLDLCVQDHFLAIVRFARQCFLFGVHPQRYL